MKINEDFYCFQHAITYNEFMTIEKLQSLCGKKVMVDYKGLLLIGILQRVRKQLGGRAWVTVPPSKTPRQFWASKISEIEPKTKTEI
jgi:hypothetical protein